MAAFSLILVVFLPMAVVSIVVACLPLRSTRLRVAVLGLLVVASVAVVVGLDAWLDVSAATYGFLALLPALLVATGRLATEAVKAVRRKGEPANP